jgi:hypothetical protein
MINAVEMKRSRLFLMGELRMAENPFKHPFFIHCIQEVLYGI